MIVRISSLIALACLMLACEDKVADSDAYGNFEANATTISAEANGRLLYLNVEEGEKLSRGQLVAIVDTTQLHLQKKQVEASIGTLPKKLRTALSEIKVLEDQKSNLIRERDRVRRLVDKKAAPAKSLDDLKGEIKVVEQRIQATKSQTETANRGILAEREPMLAQMAIIDEQIRRSYIYNPIEGTVLTRLSEAHEFVRMGSPLYRLASMDTLDLRFYISSLQLQEAKLGNRLEVLVDDGPEGYKSLEGKISWIASQAEFTPKTIQTKEERVNLVYAAKAKVPNPNGELKIGMPAEVKLQSSSTSLSSN